MITIYGWSTRPPIGHQRLQTRSVEPQEHCPHSCLRPHGGDPGAQFLGHSSPRLPTPRPRRRQPPPFEAWGRCMPEYTTAVSLPDRLLHHCHTVITDGESHRMREARGGGRSRPGTT